MLTAVAYTCTPNNISQLGILLRKPSPNPAVTVLKLFRLNRVSQPGALVPMVFGV